VKPLKAKEIRELSLTEMQDKLLELKQELFNLRFQQATNNLENPMRMVHVKKTIARIKTIIHQKQNVTEGAN
jgi:large subunit ribosomal protein L29